jgi:tRNA A-37 threonylcarbamoyl transferase component Bud32
VLSQQEWEERERLIYQTVYGTSIQVEADRTLVLPYLAGRTLAIVLENPALEDSTRTKAIESAVAALAAFHRQGFTHADAMAENVLIDRSSVARWFDFETIHDSRRPMTWRRADDVRALLVTCLIRTVPEKRAGTLQLILDAYADEDVTRVLAMSFTSVWRRSLSFHLAQAALPFQSFREVGRWLQQRTGGVRQ